MMLVIAHVVWCTESSLVLMVNKARYTTYYDAVPTMNADDAWLSLVTFVIN
jgi:hypothetical protein